MAVVYNTIIDQGADWYFVVTYADPSGTPIDISDYTAKMQMRVDPNSPTAVLTLSTDDASIVINGPLGEVSLHATALQTGAIDEGPYVYDIEIYSPAPEVVTRLVQGQIVVSAEVTH